MSNDKKLKKLINKQGETIRSNNSDFYNNMLSTYYSESPAETARTRSGLFSLLTPKRALSWAVCFVLFVSLSLSIGFGIANGKANQITLPKCAEVVKSVEANGLNVTELAQAEFVTELSFDGGKVFIPNGANLFESFGQNGARDFYYATGVHSGGFYRVQVVLNKDYQRSSRLTEKSTSIMVNGKIVTYSAIYSQNEKVVYFFSETSFGDQVVAIDYTTNSKNCEQQFIEFASKVIAN